MTHVWIEERYCACAISVLFSLPCGGSKNEEGRLSHPVLLRFFFADTLKEIHSSSRGMNMELESVEVGYRNSHYITYQEAEAEEVYSFRPH